MGPKVVEFEQDPYLDTVKALRRIADDIEKGDHGNIRMGVMVLEATDGRVDAFAFGPTAYDHTRALGLWRLGEDYLIDRIVKSKDDA